MALKDILLLGATEEVLSLAQATKHNVTKIVEVNNNTTLPEIETITESIDILKSEAIKSVMMAFDDPNKKERLYKLYKSIGFDFVSANLGTCNSDITFVEGLIIQQQAYLSTNCEIGKCVKLNVGSTIMHDAKIGDFCTVAPRATILGRVTLRERVFVGGNATILPDIVIDSDTIIGAGAVVTKNVPSGMIARGVPAKFYERRNIPD